MIKKGLPGNRIHTQSIVGSSAICRLYCVDHTYFLPVLLFMFIFYEYLLNLHTQMIPVNSTINESPVIIHIFPMSFL